MPPELSSTILANRSYQEKYHHLRHDDTRLALQKTELFPSASDWYKFIVGLMKRDHTGGFRSFTQRTRFSVLFDDLRMRQATGFEPIWKEARVRLVNHQYAFSPLWSPINDRVLLRLRDLTRTHWETGKLYVYYIDCLQQDFVWDDCIGLAAIPEMDAQKMSLARQLSELITTQPVVIEELQKAGLDTGITQTFVEMFAYFSIREFFSFSTREKDVFRPNRRNYPLADVLFPIFEEYSENFSSFWNFETAVEDLVGRLVPPVRPMTAS